MIKLKDLTPEVYSNMSRDFQFIERLFDIVLNYLKTSTETVYTLPNIDSLDSQYTDLLALSLGFYSKRHYNRDQLKALCKVFSTILRNKGNKTAIDLLLNTVLGATHITDKAGDIAYEPDNAIYHLAIPTNLADTTLISDVLKYILPAGVRIDISRSAISLLDQYYTPVNILNDISIGFYEGNSMAQVVGKKDNSSENTFFRPGRQSTPVIFFTTKADNEESFKIEKHSDSGIIEDNSNSYIKTDSKGKKYEAETSRSMVGALQNQEVLDITQIKEHFKDVIEDNKKKEASKK